MAATAAAASGGIIPMIDMDKDDNQWVRPRPKPRSSKQVTCHRLLHAGISEAPLTVMPLSRLTPGQGQQSSVTARESFSAPSEKRGNTLLLERAYVTPPLTFQHRCGKIAL
ncbi:hypothetical protein C0Q70_02759 [Pomacea canaliculata]|uniref:Uncharacterized protein n=1 Tax=Pomacea canaliculata TaxID=400727 RepID=A0A2T7PQV2_POMCA|nr:hypothetical protein C0Q70_02759 [Pomacea canaliculata]